MKWTGRFEGYNAAAFRKDLDFRSDCWYYRHSIRDGVCYCFRR